MLRVSSRRKCKNAYRIQSRRLFFFKNFLVRYLRYRFEKGILEVTVILVLPTNVGLREV